MRDILTDSQTALWVDLVHEAEHDASAPLGEELESYLVFLLIAHMRDTHLHRNAVAIDYLLAKSQCGQTPSRRIAHSRRPLSAARRVYIRNRRSSAWSGSTISLRWEVRRINELAHALRATVADLYEHLARAFARVVRVLLEVAAADQGRRAAHAVRRQRARGRLRRSAFPRRAVAGCRLDASIISRRSPRTDRAPDCRRRLRRGGSSAPDHRANRPC